MVRNILCAMVLALGGCSNGSSLTDACNHVCSCHVARSSGGGANTDACVQACAAPQMTSTGMTTPIPQACLDCVTAKSCVELEAGTACRAECGTSLSGGS
jgi:hypothetical protein